MKPARVIGAGLSGLVSAWHLAERGFDVTIVEQAARPGGLIHTLQTPHGPVETAANAFVWDDTVAQWFERLQLTAVRPRAASKRRYIFRDGRARRWPLGIVESAGLAARLGAAVMTRSTAALNGESMKAWGDRVIGAAATQWLLGPAMQGVYASAPASLSAEAIFGGRRRGSRILVAPMGGMGQFITRVREQLNDRGARFEFNTAVDAIDDSIPTVIATAADVAARLLVPHAPRLAALIGKVRIAPLNTVTMFFAPHPDDLRGFGVLFPRGTGFHALGVLFNTEIFDGRGAMRSETWITGDRDAGITRCDDASLIELLTADRRRMTGRDAAPLSTHVTCWPRAIPVYDNAITTVSREIDTLPPWLAVAGNYLGRIGVAALLEIAAAAARRLR